MEGRTHIRTTCTLGFTTIVGGHYNIFNHRLAFSMLMMALADPLNFPSSILRGGSFFIIKLIPEHNWRVSMTIFNSRWSNMPVDGSFLC